MHFKPSNSAPKIDCKSTNKFIHEHVNGYEWLEEQADEEGEEGDEDDEDGREASLGIDEGGPFWRDIGSGGRGLADELLEILDLLG